MTTPRRTVALLLTLPLAISLSACTLTLSADGGKSGDSTESAPTSAAEPTVTQTPTTPAPEDSAASDSSKNAEQSASENSSNTSTDSDTDAMTFKDQPGWPSVPRDSKWFDDVTPEYFDKIVTPQNGVVTITERGDTVRIVEKISQLNILVDDVDVIADEIDTLNIHAHNAEVLANKINTVVTNGREGHIVWAHGQSPVIKDDGRDNEIRRAY